jgi:hypothetical protein
MGWVAFAIAIAIVATIYFAIHYSGFRQFLAGLIALAVLIWAYFQYEDYRKERRIAAAKQNISAGPIKLQDAKLSLGISKRVASSILNQSRYQINRIKLHVTVRDCASISQQTDCNIIGDGVVGVYV